MAEDIVKDIGLLEIVELLAAPDERPGGKLPVGQHLEEGPRWDEARHRDHLPTGQAPQSRIHSVEIRHPFGPDAERLEAGEILLAHMPLEGLLLALEQDAPDGVVLGGIAFPALVDDAVLDPLRGQNGVSGHG